MYVYILLYILRRHRYFFFLSSFSLSGTRTTGAAGMLNHHSLSLLAHLSVFAFLGGEYLVNVSKKVNRIMYLLGMKARIKATHKRVNANFSVAC